jgi:hypothetical protein
MKQLQNATPVDAVTISKQCYLEIERALHDSINRHQTALSIAEMTMSEVLDKLTPEQIEETKKAMGELYASSELIHFAQRKLAECAEKS